MIKQYDTIHEKWLMLKYVVSRKYPEKLQQLQLPTFNRAGQGCVKSVVGPPGCCAKTWAPSKAVNCFMMLF